MDYEKKYKESMTKMSTFLAKHDGFTISKDGEMYKKLSEIFPELKESEDEKIRKELIAWLKNSEGQTLPIDRYNAAIAWLEKQGEQPNPYSGISFEYNGHIWGMCARDNGVDILLDKQLFTHLEKQGEKKSVNENLKDTEETMMYQGEVYTRVYKDELDKFANKYPKTIPHSSKKYAKYSDTDLVIAVKAGAEWQMKQNPAWSDEDDKYINDILAILGGGRGYRSNRQIEEWLKSLKDRVQPQPKQEWSKDDEQYCRYIIDFYLQKSYGATAMAIEWLENLKNRVQPHWKPTNEQMEAFGNAIEFLKDNDYSVHELIILFNDLQFMRV